MTARRSSMKVAPKCSARRRASNGTSFYQFRTILIFSPKNDKVHILKTNPAHLRLLWLYVAMGLGARSAVVGAAEGLAGDPTVVGHRCSLAAWDYPGRGSMGVMPGGTSKRSSRCAKQPMYADRRRDGPRPRCNSMTEALVGFQVRAKLVCCDYRSGGRSYRRKATSQVPGLQKTSSGELRCTARTFAVALSVGVGLLAARRRAKPPPQPQQGGGTGRPPSAARNATNSRRARRRAGRTSPHRTLVCCGYMHGGRSSRRKAASQAPATATARRRHGSTGRPPSAARNATNSRRARRRAGRNSPHRTLVCCGYMHEGGGVLPSQATLLALAIKPSPRKPQRPARVRPSRCTYGSAARNTLSVPRRLRRSEASEHSVPAVTRGRPEPGRAPV